jgi:hypothetical protein
MCIMLYKSINKKIDQDIYRNCFENNDDGAGFAYIKNNELYIAKGFFTFNEFWDNYAPLEEYASIVHFRVGSSGWSAGENCHPWRVSKDLVFGHNGVISIDRKNQSWSDTGNFCETILKPLTKSYPEWWKQNEFKWMMEIALGSTNKMVLLDKMGHHQIFNEKQGEWDDEVWYSNKSYLAKKYDNCSDIYNRFNPSCNVPTTRIHNEFSDLYTKIDTESIDARLEAAEKQRQTLKNAK